MVLFERLNLCVSTFYFFNEKMCGQITIGNIGLVFGTNVPFFIIICNSRLVVLGYGRVIAGK